MIIPPNPLSGMHPLCPLKSWIEPTSRPLSHTNSSVTKLTLAPLSIKQVVSTPSKTAVPRLALLSPSVSWGLHSKTRRELTVGRLVFGLGRTHVGGAGLPLVLTPPSRFNACFLRFLDSFSGSLHSAHRWPSFPQLKQRPHLFSLISCIDYGYVIAFIINLIRVDIIGRG